jgi:hypothetical protein
VRGWRRRSLSRDADLASKGEQKREGDLVVGNGTAVSLSRDSVLGIIGKGIW